MQPENVPQNNNKNQKSTLKKNQQHCLIEFFSSNSFLWKAHPTTYPVYLATCEHLYAHTHTHGEGGSLWGSGPWGHIHYVSVWLWALLCHFAQWIHSEGGTGNFVVCFTWDSADIYIFFYFRCTIVIFQFDFSHAKTSIFGQLKWLPIASSLLGFLKRDMGEMRKWPMLSYTTC